MSSPHCDANGCVHETMPLVLWTTERREGNGAKGGNSSAGLKAEVLRGMLEPLWSRKEIRRSRTACFKRVDCGKDREAVLKEEMVRDSQCLGKADIW